MLEPHILLCMLKELNPRSDIFDEDAQFCTGSSKNWSYSFFGRRNRQTAASFLVDVVRKQS